MKRHTKIYLDYFDYGIEDFIPCEMCFPTARAVDVHHIDRRGMGGDPNADKDVIENLAGLCRNHHNKAENSIEFNKQVKERHLRFMKLYGKRKTNHNN